MNLSKITCSVLSTLLMAAAIQAQNNIEIELIHKLNGADFAFAQEASTPENIPFELERMEYYISEINITHDGGENTAFEDVWVLAQASGTNTIIDLGSDSIETVESVSFSIGVDAAHNHLDPTTYSTSHPLGPKSPSMHWGWTAGYRFVAMEGDGGQDLDETFEIHALGDQNYFETTIEIEVEAMNGNISIPIYANYAEALRGIDVGDGVITHGDYAEAVDLLENFQDYVFTSVEPVDSIPEDTTTGVEQLALKNAIRPLRNPSIQGIVELEIDPTVIELNSFALVDMNGKIFQPSAKRGDRIYFSNVVSGVYIARALSMDSVSVMTKKLVVLE